ncbi:hypothetical protein Pelo_15836 [Pelomyxa schiedti]|nr:hypothetical protein Pelo_15825 [Pelomyxa schiedti]KAH3742779.1 hypothetical protein Pelo_15836 [Pelomyxa schiedti]
MRTLLAHPYTSPPSEIPLVQVATVTPTADKLKTEQGEHGLASPSLSSWEGEQDVPEESSIKSEVNEETDAVTPSKRTREEAGIEHEVTQSKRICTLQETVTTSGVASPIPEEQHDSITEERYPAVPPESNTADSAPQKDNTSTDQT